MARTGLPNLSRYSVVEQGNVTLGQAGVAFITESATYTPPTGLVVVAIQFTEDTVFDSSDATTAESYWPTDVQGGSGTNSVAINGKTMPQGMTIYGRWTAVALDSGAAFLYLAP